MKIDFYISVIDNYGDMGFGVNLAISLLYFMPNLEINFYSDNMDLFLNMTKNLNISNINYLDISKIYLNKPSNIIFNFFDRKIDNNYLNSFGIDIKLFNFGYFLMHNGVGSLHNTKYKIGNIEIIHLIPSIIKNTAGIIINPILKQRKLSKREVLPGLNEEFYNKKWIGIFCYKETFLKISKFFSDKNYVFLSFDNYINADNVINLPFLNILQYYEIIQVCDKNLVRGENSLCQSILSGKPFLWDIYKEKNNAHFEKINDFLDFLNDFDDFGKYRDIYFGYDNFEKVFEKFLYNDFGKIFGSLSLYSNKNCDLVKNIKLNLTPNPSPVRRGKYRLNTT